MKGRILVSQQDTKNAAGQNAPTSHAALHTWERMLLGSAAVLLSALLITAACLTPDVSGVGTHEQLGFAPCSSIVWWGVPCPSCGMTTSWAYLVRGRLSAAIAANAGGTVLALAAAISVLTLPVLAIRGHLNRAAWYSRVMLVLLLAAVVASLVQWLWRYGLVS